jgi:hypothetical protein
MKYEGGRMKITADPDIDGSKSSFILPPLSFILSH